jgi:hypothetical protein
MDYSCWLKPSANTETEAEELYHRLNTAFDDSLLEDHSEKNASHLGEVANIVAQKRIYLVLDTGRFVVHDDLSGKLIRFIRGHLSISSVKAMISNTSGMHTRHKTIVHVDPLTFVNSAALFAIHLLL